MNKLLRSYEKLMKSKKKKKIKLDLGFVWIPFIAKNRKHCNKIIFKCVNSIVGLNFKVVFAEKSTCGSCEQCTRPTKNAKRKH